MKTFRVLACNAALVLLCCVPAIAQKDTLLATPTSPSLGSIPAGSTVQQTIDYAVVVPANACKGNACTGYSRTVTFAVSAMGSLASGNSCTLASRNSTCAVVVNITAPAADPQQDKSYSVTLSGQDSAPGNNAIEMLPSGGVIISFTVPKAVPASTKTKLELNDVCGVLHASDVLLQAHLMTDPSGASSAPVAGQTIHFSFNGAQWTGTTDASGLAQVSVPIASLPVSPNDYEISAVFEGAAPYIGSSDAAWLGIKYMFQGFMPPMNADGTSVFKTGRVIPFKIRILDGNSIGGITNASPLIGMVKLSDTTAGTDSETPIQGTPDAGYLMRYTNLLDDQYIYNWDLTPLDNGSYQVMVDLQDSKVCGGWRSTIYGALISVQKKK
jgi:hypothetical protein